MLGEVLGRPPAVANCIVVAHSTAPKYLDVLKNKNQLDDTYYFIVLLIASTCFGHYYVPSSGAPDYNVDYHIGRFVLWLL